MSAAGNRSRPEAGSGRRQRGYSLIELMVASVIGLLLLGGMLFVFLGSRQSSRHADAMARMQENSRIAVELLSSEIRMAGFVGCRSRASASGEELGYEIGVADLPFEREALKRPLSGAVYADGVPAFVDQGELRGVDGSHLLILHKSLPWMLPLAADFNAGQGVLQVRDRDGEADLRAGDLLIIDDCVRGQLLRARAVTAPDSEGVRRIDIDAMAALQAYTFSGERYAEVSALREEIWFVRDSGRRNSAGRPLHALFRMRNGVVDEVVDGVADLHLGYGIGSEDAVETFRPLQAMRATDWARVVAVRVELLFEAEAANVLPDPVAVEFGGRKLAASTDARSVVRFTVALRNRTR